MSEQHVSPSSFADVISLWENAEDLAKIINEKGVTVRQWRRRGSIPWEAWDKIADATSRLGKPVTFEELKAIAQRDRTERLKKRMKEQRPKKARAQ